MYIFTVQVSTCAVLHGLEGSGVMYNADMACPSLSISYELRVSLKVTVSSSATLKITSVPFTIQIPRRSPKTGLSFSAHNNKLHSLGMYFVP